MKIEENIFKRYSPDFNKLKKYGFKKHSNKYIFEKTFMDDQFNAHIEINSNSEIIGKVFELENNDEYLPLRVEAQSGFAQSVRFEYEEILKEIRTECFNKQYYIYPQSNRITDLIINKYGDEPEFLWKKFSGSGIFRNPESKKWYAAILDCDRGKIQAGKSGLIEVIDLKLEPKEVQKIIQKPNFYTGYHMNKKSWISIILDESVSDEEIMKFVDRSHNLTEK